MFEFYYQTGEFAGESSGFFDFLKDLFVQVAGTGIGAYGAFWLYKLQTNESSDREAKKHIQQENDRLLFFDHLVQSSLQVSEYIQDGLEWLTVNLEKDPFNINNFPIATKEDLRRLVFEVKRDEIFLAYRSRLNDNKIQNIFNCIDTMHSVIDNVIDIWRNAASSNANNKKMIHAHVNSILNAMKKVESVNEYDRQIAKGLNKIVSTYFGSDIHDKRNYDELRTVLIEPAIDLFAKNPLKSIGQWDAMMECASDCRIQILDLGNQGRNLKTNLEMGRLQLVAASDTLKLDYKALSEYLSIFKKKED